MEAPHLCSGKERSVVFRPVLNYKNVETIFQKIVENERIWMDVVVTC